MVITARTHPPRASPSKSNTEARGKGELLLSQQPISCWLPTGRGWRAAWGWQVEQRGRYFPQPMGCGSGRHGNGALCRAAREASPTKMAPGWVGRELGQRLQVDGGTVGTGCQDVGDILPQESGPVDGPVGQMLSPHSPWADSFRVTSPVLALQDGVPPVPGRPLTWPPPAPTPAVSSPGS